MPMPRPRIPFSCLIAISLLAALWCATPDAALADSLGTSVLAITVIESPPLVSPPVIPAGTGACAPVSIVTSGGTSSACGATMATGSLSTGTVGATARAGSATPDILVLNTATVGVDYSFGAAGPCPGPTCTITSGAVVVTLSATYSGSVTQTGCTVTGPSPNCASFADITIPGTESFAGMGSATSLFLSNGTTTFSISTPITSGAADFSFTLNASAQCYDATSCTSIADALDPVTITGASVYDAGNLVAGASVISQSGFNPNAMPEPSSFWMLAAGLFALMGAARLGGFAAAHRNL